MDFLNRFIIRLTQKLVGQDEFGNEYYQSAAKNYLGKKRRSVIYKSSPEPSKIPPLFHAWLHYLSDELPITEKLAFTWQKSYSPNMTGTNLAYSPLKSSGRSKVSSDYNSWQPK